MKVPQNIHTVFILNACAPSYDFKQSEIGIWIGNEQKDIDEDLSQEYSRSGIRNTGFFKLDKIKTGRYLVIRRDEVTALAADDIFALMHLLVFETPNLL